VKSASIEASVIEGTAKVFDDERDAMDAVTEGRIVAGDAVVIRYEGPAGGPGMREMLAVTAAIKGAGPRQRRPAPDRRPVLRSHGGPCIGHVAPEAAHGGPIAFVRDGDRIRLDMDARTLDVLVDDAELEARRATWQPRPPRYTRGVLAKYARLVGPATYGAVCD
jgi:dihydroxy-acid dehydratase